MPTRAEIRRFGKQVRRGDRFTNRFREHGRPAWTRRLIVEIDVPRTALFVVRDTDTGRLTTMRSRTLMQRYHLLPDVGLIRPETPAAG